MGLLQHHYFLAATASQSLKIQVVKIFQISTLSYKRTKRVCILNSQDDDGRGDDDACGRGG